MNCKLLAPLLFLSVIVSAQSADINRLEQKAVVQYDARVRNIFGEQLDSIFEAFDKTMDTLITNPAFCTTTFDSLATRIIIKTSEDQRFKTYSWDNLSGGSFHDYTTYLSYVNKRGECKTWEFDKDDQPEDTYVEAGYYQIEAIQENNLTYYILLGYGTYGGGKHHRVVRVFMATSDSLIECMDCYPTNQPIVIYSNRGQDPVLTYHPENKSISFLQFQFEEVTGFYSNEFEIVSYKFNIGKFIKY